MKNKKIIIIIAVFLLGISMLAYLIPSINKANKIVKFITSDYLIEKSGMKMADELNSCLISEMKLQNNTEIRCKPLTFGCVDEIPEAKKTINKDSACAIITVDINGFNKNPNEVSSKEKIQDQFQLLLYNNGIAIIPDSVEENILFGRENSIKEKIIILLMFIEVSNNKDVYVKVKNK